MKKRDQQGQSTIEFVLTMILLLAFVLFYFQISMIFAWGSYVHYATFMAARAYLSSGGDRSDQRDRARDVIVQTLKKSAGQAGVDKFPTLAKGFGDGDPAGFQVDPPAEYSETDRSSSWMQGVRYTFKSKLFLMPLAGSGKAVSGNSGPQGSVNLLTLTSESWLGREPAYNECQKAMAGWFFDNGC